MSYITRNANLILLFLIVLVATSLVGATIYFQSSFDDINAEYNQKLAELNNVSTQLEQYRTILIKAKEELQLKLAREEEFTTKFTEVRSTAENLEQDKSRLLTDKKTLETELQSARSDLTRSRSELGVAQTQLASTKAQLAKTEADLDREQDRASRLNDDVDCLRDTADANEGDC